MKTFALLTGLQHKRHFRLGLIARDHLILVREFLQLSFKRAEFPLHLRGRLNN